MIVKYENSVTNLYKGDKVCFSMFKGGNLIYGARSPYNSETTRILMTNFPQKFVEICRYGNRHLQIVPFINEDPMLVCSLGIEGMPIRWLVGDGVAWFSTGYIPLGYNHEFYTRFKLLASGQIKKGIWGKGDYSHQISNALYITSWFDSGFQNLMMYGWQGKHGDWGGDTSGNKYNYDWTILMQFSQEKVHWHIDKNGITYRDLDSSSVVNFQNDNIPLYMFKGSSFGACKCAIAENYAKEGETLKRWYLPMIRNDRAGMVDIVSKTWKGNEANSGAFTIEYTLQDGVTSWKPQT